MVEALDTEPEARSEAVARGGLVALVAFGLVLRAQEATKSLWLDELHTVQFARVDSPGAIFDLLMFDFHAPLYYLASWATGSADPHAMRWLPILTGLVALAPLLGLLAVRTRALEGTFAAVAVFCFAPFQIRYGTEIRPYAWLQLAALVLAWAALTPGPRRTRWITFAVATAFGLYSHYLAAVPVIAVGAVRVFYRDPNLLPLKHVILAGTVGVVAFLPWVLTAESWIFEDPTVMARSEQYGEEVRETDQKSFAAHAPAVRQLLPQCLAPSLGGLGAPWDIIAKGALAAMLAFLGAALVFVWGGRVAGPVVPTLPAVATGLTAVAITLFLCVKVWERVPLQYFATGAWFWPLLAGLLVGGIRSAGRRRVVAGGVVFTVLAMGVAHVAGAPREDLARAVDVAAAIAADENAYLTAVIRQPEHYRQDEVFRVYPPAERGFVTPDAVPTASEDGRAVVVITRRTGPPPDGGAAESIFASILSGRRLDRTERIDDAISVLVFRPE